MQLANNKVKIQRTGQMEESYFGISEKDSVHIISILRDKLYSNKIQAVVREYTTNAVDAHVEAGIPDTPIEVHLPSALNSEFRVRDYGFGLTEQEIREVYAIYGASTKRNSNSVIGQLGLGGKSAFSYVDQFTITSWNSGKKSIYSAYIDESGVGKVAKLLEQESSKSSGIEIKIPVKPGDDYKFISEGNTLFNYFDVFPSCALTPKEKNVVVEQEINDTKYKLIKKEYSWADSSYIIMGGVPYNSSLIKENLDLSLYKYDIEVYVPIGTVDISANREYIEGTKHTEKNLIPILKEINKDITSSLIKSIQEAESFLEAVQKREDAEALLRNTSLDKEELEWNGYDIHAKHTFVAPYELSTTADDRLIIKSMGPTDFHVAAIIKNKRKLIVSDENDRTKATSELRKYIKFNELEADFDGSLLLFPSNQTDLFFLTRNGVTKDTTKEQQIKELQNKGFDVVFLNDIKLTEEEKKELRKINRAKRKSSSKNNFTYKSKNNGKIYKCLYPQRGLRSIIRSENWEKINLNKEELPNETKLYVPIFKFKPNGKYIKDFNSLGCACSVWNVIFEQPINFTLYGVKEKEVSKLDKTWKSFDEYLLSEFSKQKKKIEYLIGLQDVSYKLRENLRIIYKEKQHLLPKYSQLLKTAKLFEKIEEITTEKYRQYFLSNVRGIGRSFKAAFENQCRSKRYQDYMSSFKNKIDQLPHNYKLVSDYFCNNYMCNELEKKSQFFIDNDIIGYVKMKDKLIKKENK